MILGWKSPIGTGICWDNLRSRTHTYVTSGHFILHFIVQNTSFLLVYIWLRLANISYSKLPLHVYYWILYNWFAGSWSFQEDSVCTWNHIRGAVFRKWVINYLIYWYLHMLQFITSVTFTSWTLIIHIPPLFHYISFARIGHRDQYLI